MRSAFSHWDVPHSHLAVCLLACMMLGVEHEACSGMQNIAIMFMHCWCVCVSSPANGLINKEVPMLYSVSKLTSHAGFSAGLSGWLSTVKASVAMASVAMASFGMGLGAWGMCSPITASHQACTPCRQHAEDTSASPFAELDFVDNQDNAWTVASWQKTHQKPVLLVFWAPWCGPCVAEMPSLARFARKHGGLDVLPISVDDRSVSPTSLTPVITEHDDVRSTLPVFQRTSDKVKWAGMNIHRIPSFVALNGDGVVMAQFSGQKDWDNPKTIPEIQGFLTTVKGISAHPPKAKKSSSPDDKGDRSHATKASAKTPSASKRKPGKGTKNALHTKGHKTKHRSRSRRRSSESVSQASSEDSGASQASAKHSSVKRPSAKYLSVKRPSAKYLSVKRPSAKHLSTSQKKANHTSVRSNPKRRRLHTVTKRVGQSTGEQAMSGRSVLWQAMAPRIKGPVVAAMRPLGLSPHTIIYAPSDRF